MANFFMTEKLHGYVEQLKADNAACVANVVFAFVEVTVQLPRDSIAAS